MVRERGARVTLGREEKKRHLSPCRALRWRNTIASVVQAKVYRTVKARKVYRLQCWVSAEFKSSFRFWPPYWFHKASGARTPTPPASLAAYFDCPQMRVLASALSPQK